MQPEHRTDERRRAALALGLLVPAPTLGTLAAFVAWPGPVGQALYALAKLWIALLPLVWRLRVDRRPLSLSPLLRARLLPGLAAGLLLGIAMAGVVFWAFVGLGPHLIDAERLRAIEHQVGLTTVERYLAFSAYIILVNSLLEEYVWRWFVYEKCELLLGPRGGPLGAVLLSALCFTLHHAVAFGVQMDLPLAALAALGVFLGGALWSGCYRAFRSIWPGYLSHGLVDLAALWIGWRILFPTG
jgi:membrane protease YdiL (CAAX protease family)